MLTFVVWKWRGADPRRCFTAEHVNKVHGMLARFYRADFRLTCFADDISGLRPEIDARPLPNFPNIGSPHGNAYPSCYRRLWLFSDEAAKLFDGHVVSMDVDIVIAGDITALFDRDEDFIGWRDSDHPSLRYSGGLWMYRPGTRTYIWDDFDPETSPIEANKAGWMGSDQAWLSHKLPPDEPAWTSEDGIWRTRCMKPGQNDALIVQTPSVAKPWTTRFQYRWPHYAKIWNQS